jgi:SAM-dependent methyltransferase
MAGWAGPGDELRFYEINPAVLDIARTQFTYLSDCGCGAAVVMGDARLSLEREPVRHFDVLVVDAFSGDSIPVHLLTREAFEVYFRQLKPGGVLAVHVTNTYLDLARPVAAVAQSLGREAHLIVNEADDAGETFAADWVLVGSGLGARFPWLAARETPLATDGRRLWTDDFSNLWEALRRQP